MFEPLNDIHDFMKTILLMQVVVECPSLRAVMKAMIDREDNANQSNDSHDHIFADEDGSTSDDDYDDEKGKNPTIELSSDSSSGSDKEQDESEEEEEGMDGSEHSSSSRSDKEQDESEEEEKGLDGSEYSSLSGSDREEDGDEEMNEDGSEGSSSSNSEQEHEAMEAQNASNEKVGSKSSLALAQNLKNKSSEKKVLKMPVPKTDNNLTTRDMIIHAVYELKGRKGSTTSSIKKYLASNFKASAKRMQMVDKLLQKGNKEGWLVQVSGHGVSADSHFKLSEEMKKNMKIMAQNQATAKKEEEQAKKKASKREAEKISADKEVPSKKKKVSFFAEAPKKKTAITKKKGKII